MATTKAVAVRPVSPLVIRQAQAIARARQPRRGGKKKMTIPLAIVAGFIPAFMDIKKQAPQVGWIDSTAHTIAGLTGYDTFGGHYVGWKQAKAAGAEGIIVGFAVHQLASKLGLNKIIARAGIPLLRI